MKEHLVESIQFFQKSHASVILASKFKSQIGEKLSFQPLAVTNKSGIGISKWIPGLWRFWTPKGSHQVQCLVLQGNGEVIGMNCPVHNWIITYIRELNRWKINRLLCWKIRLMSKNSVVFSYPYITGQLLLHRMSKFGKKSSKLTTNSAGKNV